MKREEQAFIDEDAEIVSFCKKGNVDAFEELVIKHQKKMLNIAFRMIGDYEDACEIVQDALFQLIRLSGISKRRPDFLPGFIQ